MVETERMFVVLRCGGDVMVLTIVQCCVVTVTVVVAERSVGMR